MKRIVLLATLMAGPAMAAEKTLEQRLEALEYASYANTVSWSGYLESRFDRLKYKTPGQKETYYPMHRLLGGIDFKAAPSEKYSVFGRLAFSKFYNNQPNVIPQGTTFGNRRYADEGKAVVERFFLNYTPVNWFAFSLGRLPTMDGPPRHILDGRPRLGAYPSAVYATSLDGYALTFTPKIGENQSLAIRYILSPFTYYVPTGNFATGSKYYETDTYVGTAIPKEKKIRDVNSWMIDYSLQGTAIAREVGLIYQGLNLEKVEVTPTLDFTMTKHVLYAELNDIANLGLTFYASGAQTRAKSDGSQIVAVNPVTGVPISVAILSNEADASETGTGTIIGLNYKLPLAAANNPSLGFEAVSGSEKYLNFDFSSNEAFGLYDMRGKGSQVYWLQPVTSGVTARIGVQQGRPEYAAGLLGAPAKSEDEFDNVYVNLRADF